MILNEAIKNALNYGEKAVVILEGSTAVLKRKVRYKMLSVTVDGKIAYRFAVTYRGERSQCTVFCKRKTANEIFFALLRGKVTPCSLVYVIGELTEDGMVLEAE